MRPVMSTASGGKTTQKKYRSAFTFSSRSLISWPSSVPSFLIRFSAIRNPLSLDLTANRDKADAAAIQARRFALPFRSPCICQFARCAPRAFRGAASRHALRFPADRARPPLASRLSSPSSLHHICGQADEQAQLRKRSLDVAHLLQNDNVERAVTAEDIHAYVAFIVPGEQKISACSSYFQITNAHSRKKRWQKRLRKHESLFWSQHT